MKKKVISKKVKVPESNVYVFFNIVTKVMLFADAFTYDEAMYKFDVCNFGHRKDWKIFLELDRQPA